MAGRGRGRGGNHASIDHDTTGGFNLNPPQSKASKPPNFPVSLLLNDLARKAPRLLSDSFGSEMTTAPIGAFKFSASVRTVIGILIAGFSGSFTWNKLLL